MFLEIDIVQLKFTSCFFTDLFGLNAEIVETNFVVSCFSGIRKETTSFLVVHKKTTRNDARLVLDLTIHDQERPGTTRNEPINGGKLG